MPVPVGRPPPPPGAARAPTPLRLFVALWPGPRVRQALAACRDAMPWPAGARPTATGQLHLTLHFIGSLPAMRLAEVTAALQVPVPDFECQLDTIDCWRGGLTVLRPRSVPRRLQRLHADLAAALQRLAMPVEPRSFAPHVTLARRGAPPQPVPPALAVHWRVRGYALLRSVGDGRYELLKRYR